MVERMRILERLKDKVARALERTKENESQNGPVQVTREKPHYVDLSLESIKYFAFHIPATASGPSQEKGAVVAVRFYDEAENEIQPPYPGCSTSKTFGAFTYLRTCDESDYSTSQDQDGLQILPVPETARRVRLEVHPWKSSQGVTLPEGVMVFRNLEPLFEERSESDETDTSYPPDRCFVVRKRLPTNGPIHIRCYIKAQQRQDPKGAVLTVAFFNETGAQIRPPYPGFALGSVGAYQYLEVPGHPREWIENSIIAVPPPDAAELRLEIGRWSADEEIRLDGEPSVEITSSAAIEQAFADGADIYLAQTYAQFAHRRGDIMGLIRAKERLVHLSESRHARADLRRARGILQELRPEWRPTIPGPAEYSGQGGALRICHLMKVSRPYENTGGAVRNYYTVKSQREAGLDPYVVTPLGYPRTFDKVPSNVVIEIGGVPHYHLDVGPADVRSLPLDTAIQFETLLLAGVFRRFGGSIVHATSGYRGYESALKASALKRHFGVPFVYEVRSLHEHAWGPPTDDILELPLTNLRMAKENHCMAEADHVVTIADAMKAILVERGIPKEKISVIPNAVDVKWFELPRAGTIMKLREQLSLTGKRVIGYISNLSEREGHHVLLKAYARLVPNHPDLRCLIVGSGREYTRLENLASELGVASGVIFTGDIPHEEIQNYYRLMDVFVVPRIADFASDYVTPMKPFEALALNRPLIMSDRPVAREVVGDEDRGLLFRTGDSEHLATRIDELLRAPNLAAALASCGSKWVRAERSWEANAAAYCALYEELRSATGRSGLMAPAHESMKGTRKLEPFGEDRASVLSD